MDEQQQPNGLQPGRRRVFGRPFLPGVSGNPRGRPPKKRPAVEEAPPAATPAAVVEVSPDGSDADTEAEHAGPAVMLLDMQHVYRTPEGSGETEGQRNCRRWLKIDHVGFMKSLAGLEAKALATSRGREAEAEAEAGGEETAATVPPDETTRRLREKIAELLRKGRGEATPLPQ